ncbi:MAG TPA: protein kinase [Rhodothermales bacterium]|nr:protein kinase [Rhodothermales bacterium]
MLLPRLTFNGSARSTERCYGVGSLIGRRLSHYRILGQIGAGGMGLVYRAQDEHLERDVALKILPPRSLADDNARKRFRQEAFALSRLAHTNIAVVHDFDTEEGIDFLVTEYVPGESLNEKLALGPLSEKEVLRLGLQLAEGLAAAHARDIIHRDIKPANLRVTPEGQLKILDFGLAKLLSGGDPDDSTQIRVQTEGIVGTLPYMSPEQLQDGPIDARTDIWAAGCVLYEMATGKRPFECRSDQALVAEIQTGRVTPANRVNSQISGELARIIARCLEKKPQHRYQSAEALQTEIRALLTAGIEVPPEQARRRRILRGSVAAVMILLLTVAAALWTQWSRARWVRTTALPQAARLIAEGKGYTALRLLRQAEAYAPDDPVLRQLFFEHTLPIDIRTEPAGADIHVRDYLDPPEQWDYMGRSPLKAVRLPTPSVVAKVSRQGFLTKEILLFTPAKDLEVNLQPVEDAPSDMVDVPAGSYELFSLPAVTLAPYWIDQHEVTNREYLDFISRGGYDSREFWTQPFLENGVALPWQQARERFRDRTGRAGPATWELGSYPKGEDDYPVGGVSWYEAAAYCHSVGRHLPTIYHWYWAADLASFTQYAKFSNFGDGPEKVGHPQTLGGHGTYDMAGNVKEWVWNETDGGRRYILGGGWNEPSYMFRDHDAQNAFDRQPFYGFRCARYTVPPARSLMAQVTAPSRNYDREKPADDEVFEVYRRLYEYDPRPLDARVEWVDESFDHYRLEKVSFTAAYGDERVPALLLLPRNSTPPFQTVVWFPGANAFVDKSVSDPAQAQGKWFLFLVLSGRAVVIPIYKGTYERHVGPIGAPHVWPDILIDAARDLGRALDYIEARPDLDDHRVAYYGLSMGAGLGPLMTAVNPRFQASILLGGGLYFWHRPPESEVFNFLPRSKVPTLMINGRHDFFFPVETSQNPMFDLLGTPAAHKRHRVLESGHVPLERNEIIKESLDWLDRYLGSVKRTTPTPGVTPTARQRSSGSGRLRATPVSGVRISSLD